MINTVVSAEIDRLELISVLKSAETAFQAEYDRLTDQMEKDVSSLISKKRYFFCLFGIKIARRPLTKEEAEEDLGGLFGWRWKAALRRSIYQERLERIKTLRDIVISERLQHIRLSESDLSMLQDFL